MNCDVLLSACSETLGASSLHIYAQRHLRFSNHRVLLNICGLHSEEEMEID